MNNLMLLNIAKKRIKISSTYLKIDYEINKKIMQELMFLNIPFVLVGGWAVNNYMPSRQTKDIDILVSKHSKKDIAQAFQKQDGKYLGCLAINGDSFIINKQEIDVLYCDENWENIYNSANLRNNVKVISLGYLIIMKLDASRLQDLADCSRMLGYANKDTINKVTNLIKELRPEYLEDYYSLIELGKLEIKL